MYVKCLLHHAGGPIHFNAQYNHLVNPFPDVAGYIRHETFLLWRHFLQWLHEIGSATAVRAGQGEVGECTWRVQTAWLSLGSALKMPWLALTGPLLSSYTQTGWENSPLALHGAHSDGEAFIPVWASGCRLSTVTIASSLMGGCGLSHERVEDGCKRTWTPDRTGDMVSLIHV